MESLTTGLKNLDYNGLTKVIAVTMRRSAKDAVSLGYMLRRMMNEKLYLGEYSNFDEYLDRELHMEYSLANRFMNICKKYSRSGDSAEIAEKYADYSQGLLIEMLSMPAELEAKVTPDMTVKQVRDMKKKDKHRRFDENKCLNDLCCSIEKMGKYYFQSNGYTDNSLSEYMHSLGTFGFGDDGKGHSKWQAEVVGNKFVVSDFDDAKVCEIIFFQVHNRILAEHKDDDIIEGSFREIKQEEPEKEIIATSQPELTTVKSILDQENEILKQYLSFGDIPDSTVFRQKTIVAALAAMACDLDKIEPEEPKQPELPTLKNNEQRAAFVDSYTEWPVWIEQDKTGERYYRYQFDNGAAIVVKVYRKHVREHGRYSEKIEYGSEEYYLLGIKITYGQHTTMVTDNKRTFLECKTNRSALVEFLKNLQKGEK